MNVQAVDTRPMHFPDEVRPGIEAMVTIMSIDIGQTECLLCTVYWSCILFLDHTQLWFAELYATNIAMFSTLLFATQIGHVHHLRSARWMHNLLVMYSIASFCLLAFLDKYLAICIPWSY